MKAQRIRTKNVIGLNQAPVYHLELVRDRSIAYRKVNMVEDVSQVLHEMLDTSPIEQFVVVYISKAGEIYGCEKIAMGSLDKVAVSMKDVFRGAVSASVADIVIGHNHPLGECRPSHEDVVLTGVAVATGELLGIKILDHIIVSPNGDHYSIRHHERECIGEAEARLVEENMRRMMSMDPLAQLLNHMMRK